MAEAIWLNHKFTVFGAGTTWNDVAGVYIFAKVNQFNQWQAIYVGQASSFRSRLPTHERFAEALALGCSHIHALVVPQQQERDQLEQALIQAYQPPLNVHHTGS